VIDMVKNDKYIETTNPKYARMMSARFAKLYGKGSYRVKTLGKIQQAGTVGGLGFPSFLVRITKMR